MIKLEKRNPFIPVEDQVEPEVKVFASLADEDTFREGCVVCWKASGFTSKFTPGNPYNKLCSHCISN